MRRIPIALMAGLCLAALGACAAAPGSGDVPRPVDIGGGIGSSPCAEAFPASTGSAALSDVLLLPDDWPDGPAGSTLCTAVMTTEDSGYAQYVTEVSADEVIDYYSTALSDHPIVVSDGIAGFPILNGTIGDVEFAVQTDDDAGTILIAVALLD